MNKKLLTYTLCLFLILFLVGCKPEGTNDEYIEKPITGIDPIFKESLGYYNEFPSAFRVSENLQYVYYTRNTQKFEYETSSIAVRTGVLENGNWKYDDFKTILLPSEDGWDKYIFSPDVIKGKFSYQGEEYNYLMAYSASKTVNKMNAQIGLAVAKEPTDEFIKIGTNPVVSFNNADYIAGGAKDFKGVQEPSLISYDKSGKVQLFYSHYGNFNGSYCIEIDASNLDTINKGGRMLSEISGLSDQTVNTHLYSADWAYDPTNNEFMVIRNFSSTTTGLPSVAEAIQLVRADVSVINEVDYSRPEWEGKKEYWTLCNESMYKIGAIKTSDEFSSDEMKWNGYKRVYCATIISNPYGWVLSSDNVEVIFTSSALDDSEYLKDDEYLYSTMLHLFKIEVIRETEEGE